MIGEVGFTNDGKVFLRVEVEVTRGLPPAKLTLTWTPQDAANIARKFLEAADECKAKADPPNIILNPGGA